MKEKEMEKRVSTDDKVKRKFRKYMICLEVIECLLIVMGMLLLVSIGIELIQNGGNFEMIQNEFLNNSEIKDMLVNAMDGEMDSVSKSLYLFLNVVSCIISIVVYISSVFAIEYLRKMFKEMSETARVFSETIIKNMKKASVAIAIFAIFNMSIFAALITIIFVATIVYVFEKGYKLQIESDETL